MLRVVELEGFDGLAVAELMMYLIESAELLEKITLDSCLWDYMGTPRESQWRETEECKLGKQRTTELVAKLRLVQFLIP